MLTTPQLEKLADVATQLRARIEGEIVPTNPRRAFLRQSDDERATQRDLLSACHHLALATAWLHRAADRARPVVEGAVI